MIHLNRKIPHPVIAKKPRSFSDFGQPREDSYYWLRDKDVPEVRAVVEAENAYADAVMAPLDPLQNQLFEELKSRLEPTDVSVPIPDGPYEYFSKIPEGQQYPVYYRKLRSGGSDELLLDANTLVAPGGYLALGTVRTSPDHQWLAYTADHDGSEQFTLTIRDLKTGYDLPTTQRSSREVAWANDNRTLFFIRLNEQLRPYQVMRWERTTSAETATKIFEETDPKFFVGCHRCKSGRFIFVTTHSNITSESYFIETDRPNEGLKLIKARSFGVEYSVDHHEDSFLFLTNDLEKNFRLAKASLNTPEEWTTIRSGDRNRYLVSLEVFKDFWVYEDFVRGLPEIRVFNLKTQKEHVITFDEATFGADLLEGREYDTQTLRFVFRSPKTPSCTYDYNMLTQERVLRKQVQIPSGYDSKLYITERIEIPSHDGTQIPVSLLYRKDLDRSKPHPVLLYGYGSYGVPMMAEFATNRFSLVDRGVIWAIAHVRGGGELGRYWYEDGKFLKKKNTFFDFNAVASGLIEKGYADKNKIVSFGGSAGGLLVTAAANMRPDLYRGVIAAVPFVDVLNTMLDDSLLLTVIEYDEWGSPKDPTYFEYMKSYSPYDNIQKVRYPDILFTAGFNDPRVTYWEPLKMTAALREQALPGSLFLNMTEMGAGHGGASGRFDSLKKVAKIYAFALECMGLA